ncbi:MAG TPA: hypothetical protein VIL48_18505 [Acidimicrobiales bacterium]
MHRTMVNQRFSYEAARRALAFPRGEDRIDVRYGPDTVAFDLAVGGTPTLSLRIPRATSPEPPERVETLAYSYVDGVAHSVRVAVDVPTAAVDPADVVVGIGTGPVARELRALGLPKPPDSCSWGEGLRALFHAPAPV